MLSEQIKLFTIQYQWLINDGAGRISKRQCFGNLLILLLFVVLSGRLHPSQHTYTNEGPRKAGFVIAGSPAEVGQCNAPTRPCIPRKVLFLIIFQSETWRFYVMRG